MEDFDAPFVRHFGDQGRGFSKPRRLKGRGDWSSRCCRRERVTSHASERQDCLVVERVCKSTQPRFVVLLPVSLMRETDLAARVGFSG